MYSVWTGGRGLPRVRPSGAVSGAQEAGSLQHQRHISHLGGPTHISTSQGDEAQIDQRSIIELCKLSEKF